MQKEILATLIYYDILDFPLKAEEVFSYLVVPVGTLPSGRDRSSGETSTSASGRLDIRRVLDQLVLERVIGTNQGYYFLSGREYLVPLRRKKEKISRRKMARARRAVRWLAFVPYVQAVFASGSLGLGNCDELSDLDVLVVAKHGRIWTARLLVTGLLSLLGVRRKPQQKIAPDKICLNHYITDRSLAIPFHSLYNAQTYINLKPLYVRSAGWRTDIVSDFYKHNPWLGDYLLTFNHPTFDISSYQKLKPPVRNNWFSRMIVEIGQAILNTPAGNALERWTKKYQIRRIAANPLTARATGHVSYDDNQLAFHPDSPEGLVTAKYRQRLTELFI